MSIGIILLAAGASTRLGQSKQLIQWKGETLLEKTSKIAIETGSEDIVVVLGANYSAHLSSIQHLPIQPVFNPNWETGMGSSLKSGLHFLLEKKGESLDAILVLVCDQFLLKKEHLNRVLSAYRETKAKIIASEYEDTLGVPVLFNKSLFKVLKNLKDEEGAKKVIQQFANKIVEVPFPEGEFDLDTPEDLEKMPHYQQLIQQII